jgi:MoxR-like ATPase
MVKLVRIVTHHDNPERAAELFAEERVVAVGWLRSGSISGKTVDEIEKMLINEGWDPPSYPRSQLIKFRDEIKKGDIIVAYKKRNVVALIGEVIDGRFKFNNRNKMGLPKDKGGEIDYPNQKEVKWWDKPRDFHRNLLPGNLSKMVIERRTIKILDYNVDVKNFIARLKKNGLEVDYGEVTKSTRALEKTSQQFAILWSHDNQSNPSVIQNHKSHIAKMGAAYWGVGFSINTSRFGLPITGHLYTTDKGQVTHVAIIEDIETYSTPQISKYPSLRPPEYKSETWRSYLKLSSLEPLGQSIPVNQFKQWNGKPVSRPPQKYILVLSPKVLVEALAEELNFSQKIKQLLLERPEIVKPALAHLVAGKNIVFYGAPGTGKTRIARRICEILWGKENYDIETANSEWGHYETVGGYALSKEDGMEWKDGYLTRTVKVCHESLMNGRPYWLIIDELNRANLDLAFGKVFTLLDVEYRSVKPLIRDLYIPYSFRILATINTYDRGLLFSLGYAFMRRFAFVNVPTRIKQVEKPWEVEVKEIKPLSDQARSLKTEIITAIVDQLSFSRNGDTALIFSELAQNNLKDVINQATAKIKVGDLDFLDALLLFGETATASIIEVGQALIIDAGKFIVAYSMLFPDEVEGGKVLDEAVSAYILPQFEYFMPQLRKAEVFKEKKYQEKWGEIIDCASALKLNRTVKMLEEAKERFRLI